MNIQPRYTWEDEWEQDKLRHKQAVDKLYKGTYGAKPVLSRETLLAAIGISLVSGIVAWKLIFMVFSLPFGK